MCHQPLAISHDVLHPSSRHSRFTTHESIREPESAIRDVNSSLHMNPRRFLPALLLLFIGSGCAALIYEIVWFQLLQLIIGSSSISLGILLGTFMGGMCLGSLLLSRMISRATASAAGLCGAGNRHRRAWTADSRRDAAGRRHLHGLGRRGGLRHRLPRGGRRHLPAAAHRADGRDAAGDFALGEGDARGHLLARLLLRRQHRRRRRRLRARRLLPAADVRRRDRDLRGRRVQRRRRGHRLRTRRPHDVRGRRRSPRRDPARGAAGHTAVYVTIALSGTDGAVRRGDLDASALAAFRRDGLHLRADSRGLPRRPRHRQHGRRHASRATSRRRGAPSAGASCCCAGRSRGRRTSSPSRCRTGRSTRTSRPRRGSRCSSIWSAASGSCCPARCSGARASRWRLPRWRRQSRTPRSLPAASTPRTPSARSPARWRRASS